MRRTDVKLERTSDPIWWALAAGLCLGVMWLPKALHLEAESDSRTVMVPVGLFFCGALIGALRPYRVWRWPVASLLAFGFTDLIRIANDPKFDLVHPADLWPYLAQNASVYTLHTLPVLVGAYVGRYLSTEGAN